MVRNIKKSHYPYPKWRVYWSAVLFVLSVILAFLLLREVFWLAFYFVSMIIMTVTIYFLKTHFSFREIENSTKETPSNRAPWKTLIFYFLIVLGVVTVPLLLARFLDPYVWFTLLISFTSGISIAEVWVYLQQR